MELFLLVRTVFLLHALVGQGDGDSFVQVSQLAHAGLKNAVFIFSYGEDTSIRPESLACTGNVGCAHFFNGIQRFSAFIFLLVDFSVAEYVGGHVSRQGVHTRYTHTVQTSGNLIGTFVELTSGMKHGHYDFEG